MSAIANAFVLASAYLRHHWGRSAVLVLVAALIMFVPFAAQILLSSAEDRLTARAETTPLILGSRGSALDLTMAGLYFADDQPRPLKMSDVDAIWDSGFATPIPLHTAYEAEGFRIVGTTLDYFDFRGLQIARGRGLAVLGDAVIGADVADRLGKGPGDRLLSAPQNLFDLDGVYPLEMPISGVLARTDTPDDAAVFVDIKTTWVIAGIGHGHDDIAPAAEGDADAIRAAASVRQFQRITPENIDSFHFHGAAETYPVTAVLVAPYDKRGETILRGRHIAADAPTQMVRPAVVINALVDRIFRIKTLLDAVALIVSAAALAAVGLAIFLSWRLRAREIETAVKIGARPTMIAALFAAEMVIILTCAGLLTTLGAFWVASRADAWVGWLAALGG